MRIVTHYDPSSLFSTTDWSAVDDDTYDLDEPCGYGATEQEAIDDLMEQIEARNEDRKLKSRPTLPSDEYLSRHASNERTLMWLASSAWSAE